VNDREITSVWWRLKPVGNYSIDDIEKKSALEFASREWNSLLFSLPALLTNAKWLNPFPEHLQSAYKPF
jgi:hypothetical protein